MTSARGVSAALSVFGFLYSAYLTYREIFSIEAICQWCVMSAILLTLLAIVTVWRLLASPTMSVGLDDDEDGVPPAVVA